MQHQLISFHIILVAKPLSQKKNYITLAKNPSVEKTGKEVSIVDVEEQIFTLIASNEDKLIEMKNREKNVYKDSNEPVLNNYDDSYILNYTYCEINPVFTMGIILKPTFFKYFETKRRLSSRGSDE